MQQGPPAHCSIPSISKKFRGTIVDVAEVNQWCCLEKSGQWLENVDQNHPVLASGKLVLKKFIVSIIYYKEEGLRFSSDLLKFRKELPLVKETTAAAKQLKRSSKNDFLATWGKKRHPIILFPPTPSAGVFFPILL